MNWSDTSQVQTLFIQLHIDKTNTKSYTLLTLILSMQFRFPYDQS